MRREDEYRMRDMLNHLREASDLVQGHTRQEIDSNRVLALALVRLLEVAGEAANRVTAEECSLHPEIPWPQIVSLRNRLIHGYDSIDYDILWQILIDDLPPLIANLERILS